MAKINKQRELYDPEIFPKMKLLIKDIVTSKSVTRAIFIQNFLYENGIRFNVHEYDEGKNIEVVKKGASTDKEIIFFSHYDISRDTAEGANDNTSSVVIMLNVAKYLNETETDCTIRIVFNDNEELIGALLNTEINVDIIKSQEIINKVGSFQYLKRHENRDRIIGIFNIELSGIGDGVFISDSSGNAGCNEKLNDFLCGIAGNNNIKYIKVPFPASDMISVYTLGLPGTVIGSVALIEAEKYLKNSSTGKNRNHFPSSWRNIHTGRDNYFAIQEKSLKMIYDFILLIISNQKKIY